MTTPEAVLHVNKKSRFERHPEGTREKCFLLFTRHQELSAIAGKLGICLATVRRWSSSGKWKSRRLLLEERKPSGLFAQKKPSGPESDRDEAFEQLKTLPLGEQQTSYEQMMRESAMRVALTMQRSTDASLVQNADKWAKLDTTARKALCMEVARQPVIVNIALLSEKPPPPLLSRPYLSPELPAVEVLSLAS